MTEVEDDFQKIHRVVKMIREDIKSDIEGYEGKPLTGPNVSVMFGNLSACVDALAAIVDGLAGMIEELVNAPSA